MNDSNNIQRKAENRLRHPAKLSATIALPKGRIEVWRSAHRLPSSVAAIYVASDDRAFCVNTSWSAFEKMLREARPDLNDTNLLVRLVSLGPGRFVVATADADVPPQYRHDTWAPTRTAAGDLILHGTDTIAGEWKRLTLHNDYAIKLEKLGLAPKVRIR
jgi:hypothetical protein